MLVRRRSWLADSDATRLPRNHAQEQEWGDGRDVALGAWTPLLAAGAVEGPPRTQSARPADGVTRSTGRNRRTRSVGASRIGWDEAALHRRVTRE